MVAKNKNQRERAIEIAVSNLELKLFQDVAGSNIAQNDIFSYGKLGVKGAEATYMNSMNGDQVKEMRDEEYNTRLKEGEALGVYGRPTPITDYDVSLKIAKIQDESKRSLPLKELEKVVKGITTNFNFKVPKELENYIPQELILKIVEAQNSEKIKGDGLTEREKDAFISYGILSKAYDMAIAIKSSRHGYFAELNAAASQISEKYRKPEEK